MNRVVSGLGLWAALLVLYPLTAFSAPVNPIAPQWNAYRQAIPLGKAADIISAVQALPEAAQEAHLTHAPELSAVLLRDADALASRGDWPTAMAIAETAARLAPRSPEPHQWLSHAWWTGPEFDLLSGARERAAAWKRSYGEFWSLLYRGNRIAAAMLLSLLSITMLVVAVFSLRVLPLLAHLLVEWSGHRLFRPTAWVMSAWVLLLPLVLVPWSFWLILVPSAIAWWFLTRGEQWLLSTLAAAALASAFAIPAVIGVGVADHEPRLRLLADVAQGKMAGPALEAVSRTAETPQGLVARALALTRENREDEAAEMYQKGLRRWPDDARLLTNYGNILFHRREYARAVESYEAALRHAPESVAVLFNLSQAYRADLQFEAGESRYQTAKTLDAALLDTYAAQARRGDAFLVAESGIGARELWAAAVAPRPLPPSIDASFQRLARHLAWPVLWGLVGIFALCSVVARFVPNAAAVPCITCGTAVCRRCQRYFLDLKLCPSCWKSYAKGVKLHPNATLPQARQRWAARRKFAAALAIVPGAGHLALGSPWIGALIAWIGAMVAWSAWLSTTGWQTAGARLMAAPWYAVWAPAAGILVLLALMSVRLLLNMVPPPGLSMLGRPAGR
ncbi:MAG: tetratricopeptide repeat protein [Nitrospiria bacterium]